MVANNRYTLRQCLFFLISVTVFNAYFLIYYAPLQTIQQSNNPTITPEYSGNIPIGKVLRDIEDIPELFIIVPGHGTPERADTMIRSLSLVLKELELSNTRFVCDIYIFRDYQNISEYVLQHHSVAQHCSLHDDPNWWVYYLERFFDMRNLITNDSCSQCTPQSMEIYSQKQRLSPANANFEYGFDTPLITSHKFKQLQGYPFVLMFLEDIELQTFNITEAMELMKTHKIDVLTSTVDQSDHRRYHRAQHKETAISLVRGTELQIQLFNFEAYLCLASVFDSSVNRIGWGYDLWWSTLCNSTFGIVGRYHSVHRSELSPSLVQHLNPRQQMQLWERKYNLTWSGEGFYEIEKFMKKYGEIKLL